jgi:hypothetical protein
LSAQNYTGQPAINLDVFVAWPILARGWCWHLGDSSAWFVPEMVHPAYSGAITDLHIVLWFGDGALTWWTGFEAGHQLCFPSFLAGILGRRA